VPLQFAVADTDDDGRVTALTPGRHPGGEGSHYAMIVTIVTTGAANS
jgi:hypothetical protein